PRGAPGYFGRAVCTQQFSAVTAACMVMRRDVFLSIGGFDDANFAVAYNDVDIGLRLREAGYSVVWTPYAELFHLESASLGPPLENALARLRALPVPRWISPAVPREFARWIGSNEPARGRWARMTGQELPYRPLISIIVPVYRLPREVLRSTLRSITRQSY